jgi:hypothetical protein
LIRARLSVILLLPAILLATLAVAGCTTTGTGTAPAAVPAASPTATPQDSVVLTINGSVGNPLQLKSSDLDTYPEVPVNMSDIRTNPNVDQSGGPGPVTINGNDGMMPAGANGGPPSGANGYQSGPNGASYPGGTGNGMPGGTYGGNLTGAMNATGFSLNALLDEADPSDSATNVTFLGTGGRIEVIPLSEIRASTDAAIVALGPGMLAAFVPGTAGRVTVPGLTGILVS